MVCNAVFRLTISCCVPEIFIRDQVAKLSEIAPFFDQTIQENRAVARKPRDAAAVLFSLKFADDIHYKFKSSQASKVRLQSSKHTGTKQNLTQNGDSGSFKVTCFGVSGKAIRH